ncbi:MAG: sigma-54-dependent transcriptional regulator [Deferrisomatales bacterium]
MADRLLVVDDDEILRSLFCDILRDAGHRVDQAACGAEGLERLRATAYDLVVTDLRMPDFSGLELMARARGSRPGTRWIVITAFGSIEGAVEAIKAGASDYVAKPLRSPEELRRVVARVLKEATAAGSPPSGELGPGLPPADTVFLGAAMGRVRRLVEEVAPTPATVLVTGPSGTGKELVARALHAFSPRRNEAFVAVHCAALAESVLESELFGHEKGSFTGASAAHKGRFELADGGTLFLDEVGELPPPVQVKLLRALQERTFERVGGTRTLWVDVRVVAATHRDLKAEMAAGRFREDLYYRLNVFPIALPGLAQRPEAVEPLARHFAARFAAACGKPRPELTPAATEALLAYGWPGNVRELQNAMERAVILAAGWIEPRHLNLDPAPPDAEPAGGILKATERQAIERALASVGGHRDRAAKLLGISRRTLQYRIKDYGL